MYEYNMKMSCLEDENPRFYKKKSYESNSLSEQKHPIVLIEVNVFCEFSLLK